jgi:hypothetical protein
MSSSRSHSRAARDAARDRQVRRRRFGAVLGPVIAAIVLVSLAGGGGKGTSTRRDRVRSAGTLRTPGAAPVRVRVEVVQTGTLPAAEQDAAAVVVAPSRFLLIGGIDQAEASLASIVNVDRSRAHTIGTVSTALHDASASFVEGAAYLFGGGVVSSFAQIIRVNASGGSQSAGKLPTPASDVASATIGGTVYIVGGYTGLTPLRTILAWRPGLQAHVAGMLPRPLRYAAVAAVDGQLVIVGGTSGEEASRDIYRFDPSTGKLTALGVLPSPLTHAAAAALNGTVFVFGGRGASATSQTRRILAISANGKAIPVGVLPVGLSDLAAVSLGGHVMIAGGRDDNDRVHNAVLTVSVVPS